MKLYYSAKTGGFYDSHIHKTLPHDAVEISAQTREALIKANTQGARIEADTQGYPQAVFPTADQVLARAKKMALTRLTDIARSQRQQITGIRDEIEVSGLLNKYRLAQAIRANTATPDEKRALEGEIKARALNESMDSFCEQLIEQGAQFMQVMGVIDGLKHHGIQAVHRAKKESQLEDLEKDFAIQLNAAMAHLKEVA